MTQQRKGYKSTKPLTHGSKGAPVAPAEPEELVQFLADKHYSYILSRSDGIHGDQATCFPSTSNDGMNHVLVMHFNGYNKLIPMNNRTGIEYVRAYELGIDFLKTLLLFPNLTYQLIGYD